MAREPAPAYAPAMRRSDAYLEVFELFGLVPTGQMLELVTRLRPSLLELGQIIARSGFEAQPQ
jgi:hypothetical protein